MAFIQITKKGLFIIAMIFALGITFSLKLQNLVLQKEIERLSIEFESMVSNYTISLQKALEFQYISLRQFSSYHSMQLDSTKYTITHKDLAAFVKDSPNIKSIYFLTPASENNPNKVEYSIELSYSKNNNAEQDTLLINYNSKTQGTTLINNSSQTELNLVSVLNKTDDSTSTTNPTGFFVAEIDIESLSQDIIGRVMPEWLDIHIYLTKNRTHNHLYGLSGTGILLDKINPLYIHNAHSVFLPGSLSLKDATLSILYIPDETQHFRISTWQRYSILSLGCLITTALCLYLLTQKMREEKINSLVLTRTHQLKVAAERLEIARKEQQVIFDTVPAQIWYKDLNNKIVRVNQHAAEYVGKEIADIQNHDAIEFLPADAAIEDATKSLPIYGIVTEHIDKNKQKHWLQIDKVPFYDEQGHACGVIVLCNDITELKNMTDALFESEERFQLAVEGTNDGVWDWPDIRKDIQYWSPHTYELLGYKEGEVKPSNSQFEKFLHPDDFQNALNAREEHLSNHTPYNVEYRLLCKDGEYRWYHSKGSATYHEDGSIRMTGSISDIHDLVLAKDEKDKMAEQLRQAQKLESIGQLAAGIAHEINTPIQFIGDNLQFIEGSISNILDIIDTTDQILANTDKENYSIETIKHKILEKKSEIDLPYLTEEVPTALLQSQEGVSRVSHIVKAMKEFSHPSSDSMSLADLNKAITSTVTVSKSEWKLFATVETDFDADLPNIECYPGEINQTILNIIVNAAHAIADIQKYQPEHHGLIKIQTMKEGENAIIKISDNGKGMPESVKSRIFEHFFTTKEAGKGTGQGLSIAYAVVTEKHHGSLEVTSQEGKGTTFTITLPISSPTRNTESLEQNELKKIA